MKVVKLETREWVWKHLASVGLRCRAFGQSVTLDVPAFLGKVRNGQNMLAPR